MRKRPLAPRHSYDHLTQELATSSPARNQAHLTKAGKKITTSGERLELIFRFGLDLLFHPDQGLEPSKPLACGQDRRSAFFNLDLEWCKQAGVDYSCQSATYAFSITTHHRSSEKVQGSSSAPAQYKPNLSQYQLEKNERRWRDERSVQTMRAQLLQKKRDQANFCVWVRREIWL